MPKQAGVAGDPGPDRVDSRMLKGVDLLAGVGVILFGGFLALQAIG
jgi:hypothetical protein